MHGCCPRHAEGEEEATSWGQELLLLPRLSALVAALHLAHRELQLSTLGAAPVPGAGGSVLQGCLERM